MNICVYGASSAQLKDIYYEKTQDHYKNGVHFKFPKEHQGCPEKHNHSDADIFPDKVYGSAGKK